MDSSVLGRWSLARYSITKTQREETGYPVWLSVGGRKARVQGGWLALPINSKYGISFDHILLSDTLLCISSNAGISFPGFPVAPPRKL